MMPIPTPHFAGQTTPEQLAELRRALIRLVDELNMILPMLETRKGEDGGKGNSA